MPNSSLRVAIGVRTVLQRPLSLWPAGQLQPHALCCKSRAEKLGGSTKSSAASSPKDEEPASAVHGDGPEDIDVED
eukprot:15142872-Alexandrium_andersonii.AAC.1